MKNLNKKSSLRKIFSSITIFSLSYFTCFASYADPITLNHGGLNDPSTEVASFTTEINQAEDEGAVVVTNNTGLSNGININGVIRTANDSLSVTNIAGNMSVTTISSDSGDLDFVNGPQAGTTTANINLGNNNNSSVTLNGGTLAGNVTLNNPNQILTFNNNAGLLNGQILGNGEVRIANGVNTNLNGDVTANSVNLRRDSTLNNSINDNTITSDINLGIDSNFIFGAGTVTGSINSAGGTTGTVSFNETVTNNSSEIGVNSAISAVNVSGSNILVTTNQNITSSNINLSNGADLTLTENATINGNVNTLVNSVVTVGNGSIIGDVGGKGVISTTASGNATLDGVIGAAGNGNGLNSVEIVQSSTLNLTSDSTMNADSIDMQTSSVLNLAADTTVSNILSNTNNTTAGVGVGTVNVNGNNVDLDTVGSTTRYISTLAVANSVNASLDNDVYVSNVNLGSDSVLNIAASTIKVTNGINGNNAGNGEVVLTQNRTLSSADFNIGNNNAISELTISNDSTIVTRGSYNIRSNTVTIEDGGESLTLASGGSVTGAVNVGDDSTLRVNSNSSVSGAINGAATNQGSLIVDGNNFETSAVIGTTNRLNTIGLEDDATFTVNHDVVATNVTLGQNSVLNVDGGSVSGVINGQGGGNEVVNFNATTGLSNAPFTTTSIGANIDDVNIANGATVTTSVAIDATRIDIGTGASGALNVGAGVAVSSAINLDSGATLTLNNNSSITGAINGVDANEGSVVLAAASTFTQAAAIGSGNNVSQITIGNGSTFNNNGNNIEATNIVMNNATSTLTLQGGNLVATVKGGDDNFGIVNLQANRTLTAGEVFLGVEGEALDLINITNNSTIAANENIFADDISVANGSSVNLAAAKAINGDVELTGNATLVLNNESAVVGNINGSAHNNGTLNITSNANVELQDGSSIGNDFDLGAINLLSGATLDAASNNNAINVSSTGVISLAQNSTLKVGTGELNGSRISGTNAGEGKILFVGNNTTAMAIGATNGANSISSIDVASGAQVILRGDSAATTFNVGVTDPENVNNNANAQLTIGEDVTVVGNAIINTSDELVLSGGAILNGNINGSASATGNLAIIGAVELNGEVGNNNSLSQITLVDFATLITDANAVSVAKTVLHENSLLSVSGEYDSVIEGLAAGNGSAHFDGDITLSAESTIGANNKALHNVTVLGGTLTANGNISATGVTLVADANLNLASGVVATAAVDLGEDAVLTVNNNSVITGTINGTAGSQGELAIANNSTFATGGVVGGNASLAQITVGQNSVFNLGHSVRSDDFTAQFGSVINMAGNTVTGAVELNSARINFGNTASVIDGSLTSAGSSTIDLGNAAHTIEQNLAITATDTIKTQATDNSFGSLEVAGTVTINNGASLDIAVDSRLAYEGSSGGDLILIVGGANSNITAIAADKIDLNDTDSNVLGLLTFTTSVDGDNLVVNIDKAAANEVVNASDLQSAYNAIDQIGSNSTGALRTIQDYVFLNNNVNDQQRQEVLDSVTQNDVGVNQSLFTATSASLNVIEDRITSLNLASSKSSYQVTDAKGNKVKGLDKSASARSSSSGSDAAYSGAIGRSVWAQVLGSTAKQDDKKGFNGFDAQTYGLTFGIDQELENDVLAGIALSINNTEVESANNLKTLNIDSYQLTLYGEKKFDQYFVDGFVAGAMNRFESDRIIPLVGRVASANYDGYSFSTKFRAGYVNHLDNGIDLIPQAGLFYSYNSSTNYQEDGADTTNLSVSNASSELLIGDVGLALAYDSQAFGYDIRPQFKASYGFDFIGNQQISTANFVGQSALINASNSKSDRNILRFSAGTDIYAADDFALNANYVFEYRDTFESHTGVLKAKYSF